MINEELQNEMDVISTFNKNSGFKFVNLYKNGMDDLSNSCRMRVVTSMSIAQIQHHIQHSSLAKHDFITLLRLFTEEGVEIYQDDIQFLKNDQIVYFSMHGEDYDSSSGLAHYAILSVLGQGGFGKVLLGQHNTTKQKVAIKIVNTASIGNAEDIDMVFREAEMLKSLVHRNIVQIYNCFTLSNMQVVYVMEYLSGGELLQYLQKVGRVTEVEARIYFLQIAEAIQYCHHQKLIHRDLKLENILLADKNSKKIKIVDFGIAGMATNFDVSKIGAGSLKYMAPELFTRRLQKIGPHIDIWSLGVILYGLVVGALPFDGGSQQEVIESILGSQYSYPRDIHITNELKHLLQEIFNPDFESRIRMSDILKHPWCLGLEKEVVYTKKVQEKKGGQRLREVTVKLGGGLSGGLSRLGKIAQSVSKLSGGLSKLAGGEIDTLLKLLNDSPQKSALKTQQEQSPVPELYRSMVEKSIPVPELFRSLVEKVVPKKKSIPYLNLQPEIQKRLSKEIIDTSASFQKLQPLLKTHTKIRSNSDKVVKNYASILEKFKSDFKSSNQRLLDLKIDLKNMDSIFPKRARLLKKIDKQSSDNMELPSLQLPSKTDRNVMASQSKFFANSSNSPQLGLASPDYKSLDYKSPSSFNHNQKDFYQRVSFLPYKIKPRVKALKPAKFESEKRL